MKISVLAILCGMLLVPPCLAQQQIDIQKVPGGYRATVWPDHAGEARRAANGYGGYSGRRYGGGGPYYDIKPVHYASPFTHPHLYRPQGVVILTPPGDRVNRKAALRAAQEAELRAYAESKGLPFPESPPSRRRR